MEVCEKNNRRREGRGEVVAMRADPARTMRTGPSRLANFMWAANTGPLCIFLGLLFFKKN